MNIRGEQSFRLLVVLMAMAVIATMAVAFIFLSSIDSRSKRTATAEDLSSLRNKFERGSNPDAILDEIIYYLESDYEFGKVYACTVIREIGPPARNAIESLKVALESGKPAVEREAARAIGSLGAEGAPAVDSLIEKLADPETDVSWFSAEALGEIGLPAIKAIPPLKVAMSSSNGNMRDASSKAFNKLLKLKKYIEAGKTETKNAIGP